MSGALTPLSLADAPEPPARLAWAAGTSFQVPPGLADALAPMTGSDGRLRLDGPPSPEVAAEAGRATIELRTRAAFTAAKPTSSRLPIPYHAVPAPLRMATARLIGGIQRRRVARWAAFPTWPLDLSADFAADLAGLPRLAEGAPTPVLLTHDLDSPEGVERLTDRFLSAEESVGARSTSFVVPRAWPIDHDRLTEVIDRSHAIGIHGYDHANRTPFADPAERRRRLDAAGELALRYGATGYRAPSLVRTPELLADLAERYRFDSSIPTSGGLFPVPNNGCASARPHRSHGIWEIPLSMPRDGSLLFLGHAPAEISALWRDCARRIAAAGGVVCLLTHCEERFSGGAAMFDAYRRLLDFLAEDDAFVFSTPDAVLDEWERVIP